MTRSTTPFSDGILEVKDAADRRTSYVAIWDDESLGLIAWFDRRMVCLCAEGRLIYEDRIDGARSWTHDGCSHEQHYLDALRRRSESSRPAPSYPISPAFHE